MRRAEAPENVLAAQRQRAADIGATYRLAVSLSGDLTIAVSGVACHDLAEADAELRRLESEVEA